MEKGEESKPTSHKQGIILRIPPRQIWRQPHCLVHIIDFLFQGLPPDIEMRQLVYQNRHLRKRHVVAPVQKFAPQDLLTPARRRDAPQVEECGAEKRKGRIAQAAGWRLMLVAFCHQDFQLS